MPPANHFKSWLRCRDVAGIFIHKHVLGDTYEANIVWKLARLTVHAGGLSGQRGSLVAPSPNPYVMCTDPKLVC